VKSAAKLFDSMNDKAIERGTQHLNDGFAQFAAAMAEIERWHLRDAKRYLDRSCELLPNALTPRLWRAYVAAALFQYESAIEDADWVLLKFPETNLIQQRAEWHYQVGNYRNSIQDCDHFLKRVPVAAMPYYLRSLCHQALGEIDLSAKDRETFDEKASTGHATLVTYASNMAGWDISLHRPIHALGAIERLRSLKPDFDREQMNAIGLTLYRNGRYQEALETVRRNFAPADDEYQIHAYCLAAMTSHQLGQPEEAKNLLKQAIAIDVSKLPPEAAQESHSMKAEAVALCTHP
jgi:tetratricopeptide (TPR) repeat protein